MRKFFRANYKRPALGLLLLAVVLIYSPVRENQLLNWDDGAHLSENLSVRGLDGRHLGDIFTSYVNDVYIPLTTLSFAVEHHFFGLNPFVYHLNNLILHLLVVLLVFAVGELLGLTWPAAWVGAFIFAIHPMHVESVAWVTERKDVLYSFFYLLAVYFYLRHIEYLQILAKKDKPSRKFLSLTEVFGVLSLLAKPMALSLPLVLLLIDWFKKRGVNRRTVVEKIPLFLLTLLIAWATYAVQARIPGESISKGILVWVWTLTFYFKQFLFPLVSLPVYRLPQPVSLFNFEYQLALGILFILILILFKFRKNQWFVFAIGYFFLSIFFLLRYDDKADINVVADRFMYLPSMAICLWLGLFIQQLWRKSRKPLMRVILAVAVFMVFAFWSVKTYSQIHIWKDSITLWRYELKYSPNESIALNNLAAALRTLKIHQEEEASFRRETAGSDRPQAQKLLMESPDFAKTRYVKKLYEKAIASNPDYVDAVYNLGNLFNDLNFLEDAMMCYGAVIHANKKYTDAYFNLGAVYIKRHEPAKAIGAFNALIGLNIQPEKTYENVIVAYTKALSEKKPDPLYEQARADVIRRYQELLRQKGKGASADSLYNLATAYRAAGNPQEALRLYKKVIEENPRHAGAYLNIGVIYSQLNQMVEAKQAFLKALELSPKSSQAADVYLNLGYIYEVGGEKKQALDAYQKAVALDPGQAEAYYNMGNVYAGLNQLKKAVESYQKTIQIKPDHADAQANLAVVSGLLNK